MKLTKAKLINATRDELIEMGYREVKDTVSGANGLFIKPIPEGFFLSLGLTISKFYDTRFTASLYLSKTTRWGSSWGDIPYESYRRVGRFLTKDERRLYLDDVHNAEGVSDAWWHFDSEGDIQKFIEDSGGGSYGSGLPSNFKPVSDVDGGGARMFIQTSSKMNDMSDEEDPF